MVDDMISRAGNLIYSFPVVSLLVAYQQTNIWIILHL